MLPEFIIPKLHRVHIAWDDALLKSTDRQDLAFSLPTDVDRIFKELEASGKKKIAICAHGGLVSSESEFGQRPFYENPENKIFFDALDEKGIYPIYFVWETGIKESIRAAAKNLGDEIAENPIRFLKKADGGVDSDSVVQKNHEISPKNIGKQGQDAGRPGLDGAA